MDANLDFDEEVKRLQSLRGLDILDTPADNRYERVTRLVQNMLKVPMASFNLIDEMRQWTKSTQGMSIFEIARKESFCNHVVQNNQSIVVSDARLDARFMDNPYVTGNPNIVFYAGYPVHAPDGACVGALCAIDKKTREISAKEIQILRDLAGVLESELRLDQMTKKLSTAEEKLSQAERVSMVDPVTRLWNRHGIVHMLKREWSEALRDGKALSLIIADIDGFKNFSLEKGPEAATELAMQVSRGLMSSLRNEDSIGRVELDEFMIVLPDCSPDRIESIVNRIGQEMLVNGMDTGEPLPLTLSYGAASIFPDKDMEMTDLMRLADEAIVRAKKTGRNKTVIFTAKDMHAAA